MNHSIGFTVNGVRRDVGLSDPRVRLLALLREQLNLTGTKKGCDRGQCGACTVLVNGRRINSCLALAISHDDAVVTTIEGVAGGEELHPLQAAFIAQLPAARLAIVEGLSNHVVEWVTSGRVDVGLVYNPEVQAGLEIIPLLEEPLGLVSHAPKGKRGSSPPLPMRDLSRYPLIVPERIHAMRRLLETQAALAGIKLNIAWEVSSVSSIIDLVCAGYGHAVLTPSGVAASARSKELMMRKLSAPKLTSVLCLAIPAHKRPTPLTQHAMQLLTALIRDVPR